MSQLRLLDEQQKRTLMIAAYYRILNDQPRFRAALVELFASLQEEWSNIEGLSPRPIEHPDLNNTWLERPLEELSGLFLTWSSYALSDTPPLPVEQANANALYYARVVELRGLLERFTDEWHLPEEAPKDLFVSWSTKAGSLRHGAIFGSLPTYLPQAQPVIQPPTLEPFVYDPLLHDRAWLREKSNEIFAAVRASIVAQAEEIERQAKEQGWRELPVEYENPRTVLAVARRLYLRAVEGRTWGDVANRTHSNRGNVRKQVLQWATYLGIHLPAEQGE